MVDMVMIGEFAVVFGEKVRVRFSLAFFFVVRYADANAMLLLLPAWWLGCSIAVWYHRRIEGHAIRKKKFAHEMDESRQLLRGQKTALGAMAAATGSVRYIESMAAEEKRLRRKWRVR